MLFLTVSITIQIGTPTNCNLSICALGLENVGSEESMDRRSPYIKVG